MNTAKKIASEKILVPQWVYNNFDALEKNINGHKVKPIHKIRKEALEFFKSKGLPLPTSEDWKYTNISEISGKNFILPSSSGSLSAEQLAPYIIGGADSPKLVFIDGKLSVEHSTALNLRISGLTISQLGNVLDEPSSFKDFHSSIDIQNGIFRGDQPIVALNTTFAGEGVAINAGSGVQAAGLIQLIFVTTSSEPVFSAARILVNAAKNSLINISECHVSLSCGEYLSAPVTEINIAENAEVNYYKLGFESNNAYHLGNISLKQKSSSRSNIMLFTLGGKIVRNEVNMILDGSNSNGSINGLTVLDNNQHVDNHTVIDHALPHSESREKIKGIYAGKAKGVFNGTIIVRKDAQKTNAYQSNQTVLLSKEASIDTKPQLKIWADDVKCTHGATVGQLDEDALFYLRSRGLDKATARNLLVHAFASEVLTDIQDVSIKAFLEEKLSSKLDSIKAE